MQRPRSRHLCLSHRITDPFRPVHNTKTGAVLAGVPQTTRRSTLIQLRQVRRLRLERRLLDNVKTRLLQRLPEPIKDLRDVRTCKAGGPPRHDQAALSPLVNTIVIAAASDVTDRHSNGDSCFRTSGPETVGVEPVYITLVVIVRSEVPSWMTMTRAD